MADSVAVASGSASTTNLRLPESIRHVFETTFKSKMATKGWREWYAGHVKLLKDLQEASSTELVTPEWQERLWNDNPVSTSGACSVSMARVVADQKVAAWIAKVAKETLPAHGKDRTDRLWDRATELTEMVQPLVDRMPWVKINRLLATLFPRDYSNVVTYPMLRSVTKAMFEDVSKKELDSAVLMNVRILDRLNEVLGPAGDSAEELAARGEFVWCLWEVISGAADVPVEEKLVFPSENRRLRGLGAMPDPLNTIFDVVEFVSQNRPTRDATVDFIQQRYPTVKKTSARQYLSRVWNLFGLLRLDGEALELTPEGKRFIESEDRDVLIQPFVLRVIGPDLVLWRLLQDGPQTRKSLIQSLQEHYAGWTSSFMPNAILQFGRDFDLWATGDDHNCKLTERGRKWAVRIAVQPSPVPLAAEEQDDVDKDVDVEKVTVGDFVIPSLDDIVKSFHAGPLVVSDEVIIRMHAALHATPRKHFVLLSGLSGTGKTQIAIAYANAYHRIQHGRTNPYLLVVSVQPEWTDSTGLLGYVNPLGGEVSYVRTRCLDFLLSAHQNRKIPHFLCLDEMNLARVEYYFAPFLSAMEIGGPIEFHQNRENVDEVPPFIPWPDNLFILGTVNMDETTHAFSDKVLDRAFTLEFWDVDIDGYVDRFKKADSSYPPELLTNVIATLKEASSALAGVRQHFGYRTIGEVLGFMRACDGRADTGQAMDQAILMKVLPKLRGQDTDGLREALAAMITWAKGRNFIRSASKLAAMADELRSTGTMRFWR